jgi:hypothetical protein
MKSTHLIAALALSLSGLTYAAGDHDHGHEHKALHGGIVTEVKDVDYELVAKPDSMQLHLRDHGKPVNLSQASAKLTILVGTEKQEIELKPVGARFEAQGDFKFAGGKAVAFVSLPGKAPATVRFALK